LTLSFTNPASGATVSGTTTVTMAAGGGSGYSYVLAVDGTTVYNGTNASFSWNTSTVANGAHTLKGTVVDATAASASATLPVSSSSTLALPPPAAFTVSFTYPASGATVSGAQSVGLSTTATWGQAKTITLSVDGTTLTSQSITGTTLWYTWDTTATANG